MNSFHKSSAIEKIFPGFGMNVLEAVPDSDENDNQSVNYKTDTTNLQQGSQADVFRPLARFFYLSGYGA
jgi:hypothetical protein